LRFRRRSPNRPLTLPQLRLRFQTREREREKERERERTITGRDRDLRIFNCGDPVILRVR
jgi:hypothetical protein